MKNKWIIGFLLISFNVMATGFDDLEIVVSGLFKNQAVITINKQQHLLKVGKTSPEGVTLISANSHSAMLELDGIQQRYLLGTQIGGNFAPPPEQPKVALWPTNGMYLTPGSINGFTVDFLVDTGASAIALNAATAKRLGLNYLKGQKIGVKTAASIEIAYKVMLNEVQVGDIKLYNVEAVVLESEEPTRALLGMTFLGQLDMQRIGDKMELKKKY